MLGNFIVQDEQKELDEITAKRQKKGRNEEDAPAEEKTILHGTRAFFDFVWQWHSTCQRTVDLVIFLKFSSMFADL